MRVPSPGTSGFLIFVLLGLSGSLQARPHGFHPLEFRHVAPPPRTAPPQPISLAKGKFGKALDARVTPVHVPGHDRYRRPPLTVECWTRLRSRNEFNVLVASDPKRSAQHWELYTHARRGTLSAYLPGYEPAEIESGFRAADGLWHHVALTFDGTTVELFADGKKVKSQRVTPRRGLIPLPGDLSIGQAVDGKHRVGCDGLIDEVRISRVVRKIERIPTAELPEDADTVGMWRFDHAEGLVADPAWTPPPSLTGEAWERATDVDWVDARLRKMDTGPTFNATFRYPGPKGSVLSYKGTAIRVGEDGQGAFLFDRNQLRWAAGWTGDYLKHSDKRFGLLNTPSPAGPLGFSTSAGPGWADPKGRWSAAPPATGPLPREWGHYQGLYLCGKRAVLAYTVGGVEVRESPWIEQEAGQTLFTRILEVGPTKKELQLLVGELPTQGSLQTVGGVTILAARQGEVWNAVAVMGLRDVPLRSSDRVRAEITLPPSAAPRRFKVLLGQVQGKDLTSLAKRVQTSPPAEDLSLLLRGGPARWTKSIVTRGERGRDEGPCAIDTLTVPFDNPYQALFFLGGVDFLPDGGLAVCTAHGDVWVVRGVDEQLERLTWKRFATGLYQPLGLKVVDGQIHVLERGQLTRLTDLNGDGEADLYENVNNDWHTGSGEHSYDTCLETDPEGNFYFFKTGDPRLPEGGCLLRVARDGSRAEVFSTGFRHPIGLSVSPTGLITGADQEGNWMPATRIDLYQKGGFYGDMRAHHRARPPLIYDPPLVWLPHGIDNSAGGQVWVQGDRFGLQAGELLHLSYGRCKLFLILRQELEGLQQGGGIDLGLFFRSGVMRGRFSARDGQLYVAGMRGWQTAARDDGCLQRVRYTGRPLDVPQALAVEKDGIRLTFRGKLDEKASSDPSRFQVEQWNYRWSGDYGSKEWSVREPTREGHDQLMVDRVTVSRDEKGRSTVLLSVRGLRPVMQMRIRYDVRTSEGRTVRGEIHNTIHQAGSSRWQEKGDKP